MNQHSFRDLHDALLKDDEDSPFSSLLLPWSEEHLSARVWLNDLKHREGHPFPKADIEDLWELYALSRVCDLLLLRFQDEKDDTSTWAGPQISLDEFVAFAESLGLTVMRPTMFSAFYHEIVEATPCHDARAPEIIEYRWPCVMLGNMVLVRGGVAVSASAASLTPGIAGRSTLYWAYRRRTRPCRDLSHGWGSNSRWRTAFRRDYVIGNSHFFNVDGTCHLGARNQKVAAVEASDIELTLEERIELLTHRCFVKTVKQDDDLWPYDDYLELDGQ